MIKHFPLYEVLSFIAGSFFLVPDVQMASKQRAQPPATQSVWMTIKVWFV